MPHFFDSCGRSEKRPGLSLERDATFVPKVQYFTVPFSRIPGKTRGIPAPGTPIPESVGKSGSRALGSVVFLRSLRSPRAQISDSVGSPGERPRPRPRIFTEIRYPTPRFPGGGSGFEIRPSLSPARDATFVPEMTYFTVPFLAGSHRSRAGAAQVAKSSIVLPKIREGGWRPQSAR